MQQHADLLWIETGRQFTFDDLVFWQNAGQAPFDAAAAQIDTVVLGPHASAAFPAELMPFVHPDLTRRKQGDFSDVLTGTLGRLWAQTDAHTVFVENPHARLALDANRAPPADPVADLREYFARLARQERGEQVAFAGIDAIRPVTFSGEPVLLEPQSEAAWQALAQALQRSMAQGIAPYRAACAKVVSTVLAANPARAVRVISLHDTMNTKMHPSGAIVVERPAAEQLPWVANLGNRGDSAGEPMDPADPVTMGGATLREMALHWARALDIPPERQASALSLNHPYKGAYETVHFGRQLRAHPGPGSGVVQVEFRREVLMGPDELARLKRPGTDWPAPNQQVLTRLAEALARAGHSLREARVQATAHPLR